MELMTFVRQQWDRIAAGVSLLAGALAILLGWLGVSGTTHVAAQLPYFLSGGLFGLFLLGIGHMLWTSADIRDEWSELRAIRLLLEADASGTSAVPSVAEPVTEATEEAQATSPAVAAPRRKRTAAAAARVATSGSEAAT